MNLFTTIIVAGGKGLRMKSDLPKQFIEIGGKPLLMHTIKRFYEFSKTMPIILVLPENHIEYWNDLCKQHNFLVPHTLALGGENRFYSVKNGLEKVVTKYVAVHDGVRPLVNSDTIKRCFDEIEHRDAVIPVVDLVDSIRIVEDSDHSKPTDRSEFKLVQTPQVFRTDVLKKSYDLSYSEMFTDDASVVESAGYKVKLVEGNRENVKITTEIDLRIAEVLLK